MAGATICGSFHTISCTIHRHFRLSPKPISAAHLSTTMSTPPFDPHPSLEVIGGGRDILLPAFTSLHKPYSTFPLLGQNRHVETIYASFFRSTPEVKYKRECIRTKDDGSVALDWVAGDHKHLPSSSPLLILLPGLTGGSEDSYVRHMLVRARKKGWRVVVFNSRGCGDSPVTTPQFYSASFLGDMREVVAHISNRYPSANLYAVGWSLGANILVNYLGRDSETSPLIGAVSLCNPFNLVIADEDFRKGFNVVYDTALKNALCKIFKKHALLFEDLDGEYNIPLAANAKSVREFDEGLTRGAANDPIAPARGIPREDIKENPNCLLVVTPKGGHLGWVAGAGAPRGSPWTDSVVMDFLEHLEKGASKSLASGRIAEDVQKSSEEMYHLKV